MFYAILTGANIFIEFYKVQNDVGWGNMKKSLYFIKIIFIFFALSAFCCNAQTQDTVLQNKILWINHISEIVTKILIYNDNLVLTQEYEKLLDNTNFDNLPEGEIKNLIMELFGVLKTLSDNWEEKEYAKKMYKEACDRAFRTAVVAAVGEYAKAAKEVTEDADARKARKTNAAASVATAATVYFAAKDAADKTFGDKTRELSIENRNKIHDLRIKIWNSVQDEIKKSKISDSSRVSIKDYKFLISVLKNSDIKEQFAILSAPNLKNRFSKFPAFWYYLGRSALATKNFNEAKEAFVNFRSIHRSILRDDEILNDCIIAEISLLMYDIKNNNKEIISKLEYLCKIIPPEEWQKRYFAANCYYALEKHSTAVKLLEANLATISMSFKENSHHKYVDLFGTKNIPLVDLPHDKTMELHRTLIAQILAKEKKLDFEDFIQKYNHHKTLTIYEKMAYFGAVSNNRIVQEIKTHLASVNCEIYFSVFSTLINISLPTEWFCSSPMPKFTIQLDNTDIKIKKVKIENRKNKYITLEFTTSLSLDKLKKSREMFLTIHHQYIPVKLSFSIPDIPDVEYEVSGKNKYTRIASKVWNITKATSNKTVNKIKNHQYKLSLEKFIFNGKEESVK